MIYDLSMWPPPTNGMSADDLRRLLDISIQSVEHSRTALEIQCEKEGHVWGVAQRKQEWMEGDKMPDEHGSYSTVGGGYRTEYVRQCTRCGKAERRAPVVKEFSPFEKP